MVEADGSYGADLGAYNVGGVKPSAEADLDNGGVDFCVRECEEGQNRHILEKRRIRGPVGGVENFVGRFPEGAYAPQDFPAREFRAAYLNPFADVHEVRRGEHAGLEAARAQNALEHRADGTLAVRARHVYHGIFQVRISEGPRKLADPVQGEFRPGVAQVADEVEGGLEVGEAAAFCRDFGHNQARNSTTGRAICKEE